MEADATSTVVKDLRCLEDLSSEECIVLHYEAKGVIQGPKQDATIHNPLPTLRFYLLGEGKKVAVLKKLRQWQRRFAQVCSHLIGPGLQL